MNFESYKEYKKIESLFIEEIFSNKNGHELIFGDEIVILTAPHSVNHFRKNKEKIGEYRTGLIVYLMNKKLNYSVAYKTQNLKDDANYDTKCLFKQDLINNIYRNDIKLLIDLHISSPDRNFSIDIGTGQGVNIQYQDNLLNILTQTLEKQYENVKVNHTFAALYQHSVSSTVSRELSIPAFQLEINWNIIDSYEKVDIFIKTMNEALEKMQEFL